MAGKAATKVCWKAGTAGLVCGIVVTGAGALAGSIAGMSGGEKLGEVIFEVFDDD